MSHYYIWLGHAKGPNMQILTNSIISPFSVTFKTPKKIGIHLDAKLIDLQSNFNCKLRDWSTRYELLYFFISVSSIACQEHLVKTFSFFYNHTGYLLSTQLTIFWAQKWISYVPKCKISKREVRSVTKQPTFGAWNLPVTFQWQPFASLVLLPRKSVTARRHQFFINKSEKFKVGVKWGIECKYKILVRNVLIYRL